MPVNVIRTHVGVRGVAKVKRDGVPSVLQTRVTFPMPCARPATNAALMLWTFASWNSGERRVPVRLWISIHGVLRQLPRDEHLQMA